jgi:uncharacterized membrane protein YqjE
MSDIFGIVFLIVFLLIMWAGIYRPFQKNALLAILLLLVFSPAFVIWAFIEGLKVLFGRETNKVL